MSSLTIPQRVVLGLIVFGGYIYERSDRSTIDSLERRGLIRKKRERGIISFPWAWEPTEEGRKTMSLRKCSAQERTDTI